MRTPIIMAALGLTLLGFMGVSINHVKELSFMNQSKLAPGTVENILSLPEGNSPEGVALDRQGNIYVGNRIFEGTNQIPEIIKITPSGTVSILAVLPVTENPEANSLLGLATDAQGSVYAAMQSVDAAHGVWKIGVDGSAQLLPGSNQIVFPNALVFDPHGNLYVTDSASGSLWRMDRAGHWTEWVQDPLLEPPSEPVLGLTIPGANGIAFYPPNTLFVANTLKGLIAKVSILSDGSAGPVELVADDALLLTVDGIAVDKNGDIHGVIPGYALLDTYPLVRVDPSTGSVEPSVVAESEIAKFDFPLSIAFGHGQRDNQSVYITNGDFEELLPGGPGAGLVRAVPLPPGE